MAQDPWVAIREQPYGVRAAERDSLVRTLLLYAVKRIANDETFAPFGAVASADGTLRLVDPGGDARQPPSEVLPYLEQTLLKDEVANGARAVASVADATAGGKVVTICIHVEHRWLRDGRDQAIREEEVVPRGFVPPALENRFRAAHLFEPGGRFGVNRSIRARSQ